MPRRPRSPSSWSATTAPSDLRRRSRRCCAQLRDDDEVVVVDSASSDDRRRGARGRPARACVDRATTSASPAAATRALRRPRAPLLLLLNPDAVPAPGCLDAPARRAGEQPDWGAWQALVTLADGERVNTRRQRRALARLRLGGRLDARSAASTPDPHEVAFASGAAMVVRRAAWDAAGGFDARYFMYGEDLDLSLRLRLAGWGVGIVPAARVGARLRASSRATTSGSTSSATAGGRCSAPIRGRCSPRRRGCSRSRRRCSLCLQRCAGGPPGHRARRPRRTP